MLTMYVRECVPFYIFKCGYVCLGRESVLVLFWWSWRRRVDVPRLDYAMRAYMRGCRCLYRLSGVRIKKGDTGGTGRAYYSDFRREERKDCDGGASSVGSISSYSSISYRTGSYECGRRYGYRTKGVDMRNNSTYRDDKARYTAFSYYYG